MAYSHSQLSMLGAHDFISDLHGLPAVSKSQPFWSFMGDSQTPAGLHFHGDSSNALGNAFAVSGNPHNLPIRPLPSNAFGDTTNFNAPSSFTGALESQMLCSPKTVTPSQLYDAVPSGPNTTSPHLLGQPFSTPPSKAEAWDLPSSSSSSALWSSPGFQLPSAHGYPDSPSPTPRRRSHPRTRPNQLPTPPLSSASSASTAIGSRTAQSARQRYPGMDIPEVSGGKMPCNLPTLEGKVCGKRFVRQEHLTRHKKSSAHSNVRLHPCKACQKTFDRSDNCRSHLERHFHLSAKSRTKPPHIRCEDDARAAGVLEEYWEYVARKSGGLRAGARGARAGKRPRRLRSVAGGGGGGDERWALAAEAAALPSDSREALRRIRKQGQRLKMEDGP